jgi:hypothetical protein
LLAADLALEPFAGPMGLTDAWRLVDWIPEHPTLKNRAHRTGVAAEVAASSAFAAAIFVRAY